MGKLRTPPPTSDYEYSEETQRKITEIVYRVSSKGYELGSAGAVSSTTEYEADVKAIDNLVHQEVQKALDELQHRMLKKNEDDIRDAVDKAKKSSERFWSKEVEHLRAFQNAVILREELQTRLIFCAGCSAKIEAQLKHKKGGNDE